MQGKETVTTEEAKIPNRAPKSRIGLLLTPAIGYLLIFYTYPLLRILLLSFFDPTFSIKHYSRVFSSPIYLAMLGTTLKISVGVTLLSLLLGYPLAVLLDTVKTRTRNLLMIAVVLPYFTSILVRSYAWLVILGREGMVNECLHLLGIIDKPIKMVYNTPAVFIGMTHILLPIMVLCLYAVIRRIDKNLIKVSESLGASRIQTFLRIYFPLSLPGVGAGCILVFIYAAGYYITPALLGGLKDTMISMMIASQIDELLNWGFAGALSVMLLIVTLGLFIAFNRMVGLDRVWGGESIRTSGKKLIRSTRWRLQVQWLKARLLWPLVDGFENGALLISRMRSRLWHMAAGKAFGGRLMDRSGRKPLDPSRFLFYVFCGIIIVYLIGPILLIFPISITSSIYLQFPPDSFSLRWFRELLEVPIWRESAWLSLRAATLSMLLSVAIGTFAALGLTRSQFRGKDVCYLFILSPIIVPVIVTAVCLFYFFSQVKLVGTIWGLVLGHSIGSIPLVIVILASALKGFDINLERAANSLGAKPIKTFFSITFPILRPAVIVAGFLAFIHSFDELIIALFVGGLTAETLPKKLWEGVHLEIRPTLAAVSACLVGFTILTLLSMEFFRRQRSINSEVRR